MDFVEVEGKTYEEAIRKASLELNAPERDLDIDVTGGGHQRYFGPPGEQEGTDQGTAPGKGDHPRRLRPDIPSGAGSPRGTQLPDPKSPSMRTGSSFSSSPTDGDVLIGKDGETLEAVQHILRLAIAKRYKQGLKVLVDINGYGKRGRRPLTVMAKRMADKAKRTGKKFKTDPLNPYERRIVHSIFKHNKNITTKSEGEGHTKKVVISPIGTANGKR